MIELVFTACLIAAPTQCKEVRLNFSEESVTPWQCLNKGQVAIAEWSEANPNYWTRRYRCKPAGAIEASI